MPRWSKPSAREKLLQAFADNPDLTRRDALRATGVSRQRLHQLLKEIGKFIPRQYFEEVQPREWAPREKRLMAAPIYVGMSPYMASYVSEVAVCLDLLQIGFDVYRSVTGCGMCDLVAINRRTKAVTRIEVKTGRRTESGRIVHTPTKKNSFDVLAVVLPGGEIAYTPPSWKE